MSVTAEQREKQVKQAEELLFSGPQRLGFAKGLFYGRFQADWVMPYPQVAEGERAASEALVESVRKFAKEKIDADAIDRNADIPRSVIDGLAELGVYKTTAPKAYGGLGMSQKSYCRVLEELGKVCASTSIFVNVQHSIGLRALLLFGTEEQKRKWLPPILSAEKLAAFALTEPEAGSDAANVQTKATPSADGSHYVLNGQKRYITSGGIAHVLTVMARTPDPKKPEGAITAFIVTPDMPGFKVVEARMDKLGIRGTATSKLAFENMKVPKENVLGQVGKGLKIALTVLDFGRTTFGACCTGTAKTCLSLAVKHVNTRKQFGQTLGEFELVQKKIANMAAYVYAMEAMTYVTADLIDRDLEDYMLETAMLKVYTTEVLWTIVNDAFQVHGGAAYFTDNPLERILRDARINQIGEGSNEILMAFIALVGIRGPGEAMKEIADSMKNPIKGIGKASRFAVHRLRANMSTPSVPVKAAVLQPYAQNLGSLIKAFDKALIGAIMKHREALLDRQLVQERIAMAAMELFAQTCVLSRLDSELAKTGASDLRTDAKHPAAEFFLQASGRRVRRCLAELRDNDDSLLSSVIQSTLRNGSTSNGK